MKNFKKLLSITLAVLMVFSTMSIATSAVTEVIVGGKSYTSVDDVVIGVPETIYMVPSTGASVSGQYFVNNVVDENGKVKLEATNADTTGQISIYAPGATKFSFTVDAISGGIGDPIIGSSNISTTTSWEQEWAFTELGGTTGYATNNALQLFISGTGLNAGKVATIKWTITLTYENGTTGTYYAYSTLYSPYYAPVGAATRVKTGDSKAFAQSIAWVSGVHNYTPHEAGTHTIAVTNNETIGNNAGMTNAEYYPKTSSNAMVPLIYGVGNGSDEKQAVDMWIAGTSSNSTLSDATIRYSDYTASGSKYGALASAVAPLANITVDISRYSNLNQIPNLTIGYNVTDRENADSVRWYASDFTDTTKKHSSAKNGTSNFYSDKAEANAEDITGQEPAWFSGDSAGKILNGNASSATGTGVGVEFDQPWDRAVSGAGTEYLMFKGAMRSVRGEKAKTDCDGNITGYEYDANAYSINFVQLKVDKVDKTDLRNLLLKCTSFNQSNYTSDSWDSFIKAYEAAARLLGDPTATNANNQKTALERAIAALKTTVTLHKNDGTTETKTTDAVTIGDAVSVDITPGSSVFTRDGYDFYGWATTANATSGANTLNVSLYDRNVYAVWSPVNYDVVFNGNGATGGTQMKPQTFTYDTAANLTANTFTRDGYSFIGWATSADGDVVYQNAQEVKNLSFTAYSTVTLYAVWSANSYTIEFDANGGTGTFNPVTLEYDQNYTLPGVIFTKPGYQLIGWATKPNASMQDILQPTVRNLTNEEGKTVTIYAVWQPNTYTITYLADNGPGAPKIQTFTFDDENLKFFDENTFEKEGGELLGWATSPDGDLVYEVGEEITTDFVPEDGNTNVVLYAVWDIAEYTVEYKNNGATEGADYSQNVQYSTYFTLPTEDTFKKAGYTLLGWSTSADATVAEYAAGAEVKNLTDVDGAKITLYAVWVKAVYTVTFVFADGTSTSATYGYGDTVVVPANTADNFDNDNHYTYAWPTVEEKATASKTYNEIKDGKAHELNLVERLNPTCTEAGYETLNCACGFVKTTVLDATGHDYKAVVTAPTCTEQGYTTYTCSKADCDKGDKYTYVDNYVDALGHTEAAAVKENVTLEDCGNDGYYEDVVYCSVCDEELSRTPVTVPATGNHQYGAGIVTDPTCTEPGGTKYVCSVCDHAKYDNPVDPLGHAWAATTYSFAADGKTCTAQRVCTRDGEHVETAEAEITSEQTTAPTCTVDGWTTYTATFDVEWAATQNKDVQDIPAIKHDWAATTYNFASDGSTCTATRVCNNDKNHVETENAVITDTVKTPATCTEKGWTTYTAKFDVDWAETQILDVEDIAALGHTDSAAVKEKEVLPTCTEKGSYDSVVYCSVCDEELSRTSVTVPRLGHDWDVTTYNFAEDGSACTATRICKTDATHVETVEAAITSEVTKAPTCDETGDTTYTAHFYASWAENQTLIVEGNVPAAGHKEDRFTKVDEVAATCNTPGSYTKVINCMVCGIEISRTPVTVPATGDHKEAAAVRENEVAPTCGKDGSYDLVVYCTECKEVVSRTTHKSLATGKHTAGEVVVENATDPACGVEGSYDNVVYCTVCDKELSRETITIPATENHVPVDEGVVTPPTCTEDGYTTLTCSKCDNEYKVDVVPALGHTEGEVEVENEVDATCSAEGSYDNVVYCTECDEELSRETVTVDKLAHTEETVAGYAPTCTVDGLTDGVKCSVCDETITAQEVIPATGHTAGEVVVENEVDATCTVDGSYDNVTYCTVCDAELSRETVVVPATGHDYDTVTTDPTCTTDGYTTYTCSVCDDSYEADIVAKLGHAFENYESDGNATCTADGTKTAKCERCDETDTIADEGSALGHSFTNYVPDNNAACEKDGTETAKCDRCDETDTKVIEGTALEHSFTDYVSDDNATCLEDGTKTAICDNCKEATHTVAEEGTAKGHIYENYVADGNATCTKDGTKTSKCTRCDVTFTAPDKDSALGHDFTTYISDGNATCTKNGTKTSKCTRCTVKFTIADIGTALGHSYTVEAGTTAGNCQTPATTTFKCERCDATNVVTGELGECVEVEVKEYTVEPTCSAGGKYDLVKRCEICGEEKSRTTDIDAPAIDHNYVFVSSKEGTCVTLYSLTYKCSFCDAIKVENGDAYGNHSPKASKQENVKLPTCAEEGSYDMVARCRYCDEVLKTTSYTVPKLDHSFTVKVDQISGNCLTGSSIIYKCQYCTETQTVEGLPGTHKKAEKQENVVAATCAERGSYDKVSYCTVCDAELSRTTVSTPKLSHKSTDVRIENEIPATSTATGSYEEVVFCEDCNTELSRVKVTIPATGSNSGSDNSGSDDSGSDDDSGSNSGSGSSSSGMFSWWEKLLDFFRMLLSFFGIEIK